MKPYFYPAKLIKYNQADRTCEVHINGLTDGSQKGLTALIAYPIGDDDLDTEREMIAGADVWVFFENGDQAFPVVAFYRSHGRNMAVKDIRRIRQKNIEVLARSTVTINANEFIQMTAKKLVINAQMEFNGNITHNGDTTQNGNQNTSGTVTASNDVVGGGKSLKGHSHSVLSKDYGSTSSPV
ncbi:hypothetical protein ACGTJS_10920 [Faucicola mancuniensis]|uniref:hypothetical protein n=1 Tax=Faucicola mancuniensis TaxID=1309795 RepID=UPI0039776CD6